MKMKKIIKTSFSILIALSVVFTSNVVYASELDNTNNSEQTEYVSIGKKLESLLPEKKEEVKEVTNIEQLDTKVPTNESDSAFKSCRLIIYANSEMEFKDIKGRNNIKSVQKIDGFYIVEYTSIKDTEDAYNFYTSLGYEVEIDEVKDAPEGVDNKDEENKNVETEDIVNTNENKDTESIDELNEKVQLEEEKKKIVVAVLDSGLNDGEDIFTNRIVEGKSFVDDSKDVIDETGHGTAMSRIILETNSDSDNTLIMPIKVLNKEGKGTTLTAYKGIKYAIEKNVDVINISMGGTGHSKLLESAINDAVNHNIPVVVSAGNNNKEITDHTPANIDSAITISAAYEDINEDGDIVYSKAPYSNFGSDTNAIDFSTNGSYNYKRIINNKEVTTTTDGTSVSAAYVSGYIAMLKQLAFNDEDSDNDILSFNDVYKSLSDGAIKLEEEKYFGNGYLKKENLVVKKSEEEKEELPVEEVEEVDEGIELEQEAYTSAILVKDGSKWKSYFCCELDSNGFTYNCLRDLNAVRDAANAPEDVWGSHEYQQEVVQYNTAGYKRLGQIIRDHLADPKTYTIYYNGAAKIPNGGLTINANKTLHCISNRDGATGLQFDAHRGENPLITVNSNFKMYGEGGNCSITNENAQSSTNNSNINKNLNLETSRHPAMKNNSTVYLDDVGLRGDKLASCVLNNQGNFTMKGGGSIIGAAKNSGTRSPLIINGSGKTLKIDGCLLNQSYNGNWKSAYAHKNSAIVENNGNLTLQGNGLGYAQVGVLNKSGTATLTSGDYIACDIGLQVDSGKATIGTQSRVMNCANGVVNKKTLTLNGKVTENEGFGVQNLSGASLIMSGSSCLINKNTNEGVINLSTMTMSAGSIEANGKWGIDNQAGGSVTFTGGKVIKNWGEYPTNDITCCGIRHSGTSLTIGGSAKTKDGSNTNSIWLNGTDKVVKQQNTSFSGNVLLTTSTNDRKVGRPLVTGSSSAGTSKYSLAYGNSSSITNGYMVKDDDGSTFTGTAVGIRSGANNGMTSTSQYLSGQYSLKYDLNKSHYSGLSPSPSSYAKTTFWWKEATTGQFSRKPTDNNNNYEFLGWYPNADGTGTGYTTNHNFSTGNSVLRGNFTYYAKWDPIGYKIKYFKNDGVNNTSTSKTYKVDQTYNGHYNGWGNETGKANYNYNGGTGTVDDPTRTYDALYYNRANDNILWNTSSNGNGVSHNVNHSFRNEAAQGETFNLYQQWDRTGIILPNAQKEGYVLDGWQINGTGTVYKPGDEYMPTANLANVNFVAKWVLNAYDVHYYYNDRNDTYVKDFCERDKTYTYRDDAPSPEHSNMLFDYDGHDSHGAKITNSNITSTGASSLPVECTFTHWQADINPYERGAGDSFINIAPAGGNVYLSGQWDRTSVTLPSGERERYVLDHWEVIINGTTYSYEPGSTFTPTTNKDVQFVAVWMLNEYYVVYNYNNGYGDTYKQTCTPDETYQYVNAPNRYKSAHITYVSNEGGSLSKSAEDTEKNFLGWQRPGYPNYAQPGNDFTNLTVREGTITLTGQWNIHSVQLPTGTREGYVLTGWQINGGGTIYAPGSWYTPPNDNPITFIAIWEKARYKINYLTNGGNGTGWSEIATANDIILDTSNRYLTFSKVNTETGKNLSHEGWSPNPNAKYNSLNTHVSGSKVSVTTLAAEAAEYGLITQDAQGYYNINLYAVWDNPPEIIAGDIYVSYDEVLNYLNTNNYNGLYNMLITYSHATATDIEDGDITHRGINNITGIEVYDFNYTAADITALKTDNPNRSAVTINFRAYDGAGNVVTKTITMYMSSDVVAYDPTPAQYQNELYSNNITKMVRFTNKNYAYENPDEGGLFYNSKWRSGTDKQRLDAAFDALGDY